MNELDTEVMAGILERRGMQRVSEIDDADLLLFNTCSIRDLAERKVMGKLGQLGRTSQKETIIGITGCMANAKKASLFQKLPHIDFVLGPNNIHHLDDILDEILASKQQIARTDDTFSQELDYLHAKRTDTVKAFVSIIRGCNKFCTYCIVPYTRGREVSRPHKDIIEEVRYLVDHGIKEITLLGQNVNSYGKDQPNNHCLFHDLLYQLNNIPYIERIRYMTSHPVDITQELMEAHRDLKTLCEFIHFPIQAGSNRILKKMNRHYTAEEYLEKVHRIRDLVPNIALGTDIIVGFPSETEEEFQETYNIMEKIQYSTAFLFAYSPRKSTPAMRWKHQSIDDPVKQDRLQRLINLQNNTSTSQLKKFLGQEVEVLVERPNAKDRSMMKGRTRCWRKVVFPGDASLRGSLQRVKIHSYGYQTLVGERL